MSQFPVVGGELCVGGIALSRLAERAGGTPFYAYDRALIAKRVAELRAILPPSFQLHYAIKANPMPALLGFMAGLVDGFDMASAGELKLALDTGMAAEILNVFAELNREGVTVLMITHDPSIAKRALRTVEIRDGRIVADSANRAQGVAA